MKGCPNLNICLVAGCPNLISGMPETRERCPNLTNKFSYWCKGIKGKFPVGHHLKMRIPRTSCSVLWIPFPTTFICILWPRFVSLQQRKWIQYMLAIAKASVPDEWRYYAYVDSVSRINDLNTQKHIFVRFQWNGLVFSYGTYLCCRPILN